MPSIKKKKKKIQVFVIWVPFLKKAMWVMEAGKSDALVSETCYLSKEK
jgi:hypothetical protein